MCECIHVQCVSVSVLRLLVYMVWWVWLAAPIAWTHAHISLSHRRYRRPSSEIRIERQTVSGILHVQTFNALYTYTCINFILHTPPALTLNPRWLISCSFILPI